MPLPTYLLSLALFCALGVTAARAQTVLLASSDPQAQAQFEALDSELRGFGALLVARPGLDGVTAEAREASARRMVAMRTAQAVVWLERDSPARVRVAGDASHAVLEAPLPEPEPDPRIFAAVAGSLVLRALKPVALAAPAADEPPRGPASAPTTLEDTGDWRPTSSRREGRPEPRFLLRAGVVLGLARVGSGHAADRAPTSEQVTRAQAMEDPGRALRSEGYDCRIQETSPLVVSDCDAAVSAPGLSFAPALELAAGARVWSQLSLSLTARFGLRAGEGLLARALLGAQLEWQQPASAGLWYGFTGGFGIGQIQVKPPGVRDGAGPYIQSGKFGFRGGALLGYRFTANVGVYVAPVLHVMFPDRLWVIDPSIGLEARL